MALWTPSQMATAMWFDASDASTITEDANGVAAWFDKSGNGRHLAQSDNTKKPVRVAGMGGYIVRFDGVDDALVSSVSAKFEPLSVVAAITSRAASFDGHLLSKSSYYAASTTDFPYSLNVGADGATAKLRLDSGGDYTLDSNIATGAAMIAGGPSIITAIARTAGNQATIHINGALVASGNGVNQSTNTRNWTVGRAAYENGGGAGASAFNGDIAELILISGDLSLSVREMIEGYLAHKWGAASMLPPTHKWRWAAPDSKYDETPKIISGTVTGADGNPASLPVVAYVRDVPQVSMHTMSDAAGAFSLAVPDATVVVSVLGDTGQNALIFDQVAPATP